MTVNEKAVLTTILYHDIFSFPLTKDELATFLIAKNALTEKEIDKSLHQLSNQIHVNNGYYCLMGRESIIQKRNANRNELDKKMQIGRRASSFLSFIPTIQFIGISGSLAIGDVTKSDDIDFFIITQGNTLFMTRFFVLMILEVIGLRRRRTGNSPKNKICSNLMIDDSKLSWPLNKRDIYTAHEIVQVYPLYQRNNTYQRFIKSNLWVTKLMPNGVKLKKNKFADDMNKPNVLSLFIFKFLSILPSETFFQYLQKRYMENHKTVEIVERHVLAFHPFDYRAYVLKQLNLRLHDYGLLTNI